MARKRWTRFGPGPEGSKGAVYPADDASFDWAQSKHHPWAAIDHLQHDLFYLVCWGGDTRRMAWFGRRDYGSLTDAKEAASRYVRGEMKRKAQKT